MRRYCLISLLLIMATLAVFWPVRNHDFVQFDDNIHVYENPYLNPVDSRNILRLWWKPYKHLYMPLTWSVWAMVAGISRLGAPGAELNPHIFHTVNLILHLLSVLVTFIILRILIRESLRDSGSVSDIRKLARGDWAAGFGALLFALHPLQVQAVAWVTGMKDLLSGLLSLVAVWQYIAYAIEVSGPARNTRRNHRGSGFRRKAHLHYLVASIAFLLALLAKPTALAVPLAAWVIDYCVLRRTARQSAAALIGWIAVAIPIAMLTKMEQPAAVVAYVPPLWARFLVAGDALAFYLYKLVLPIRLGLDYGRTPEFVLQHGWIYLTGLVPCALAVFIWFLRDRRLWLASFGVFVAGVLPVSGLVPAIFQDLSTVQDHYIYFAMLGPAMALAWFLVRYRGPLITVSCVLILGLLGIRSAFQSRTWQDNIVLFKHALKVNPQSWFARTHLGITIAREGKLDEAIAQYSEALRIKPGFSLAHYNLGNALLKQRRFDEAITHYSEALRITPDFAEARKNLRYALREAGRSAEESEVLTGP